ncbi:MAG TPA: hypothetical protein VNG33_08595 [Polyangiaceae bacterium]|nr:hypothetical protein [Polyangiaceae bacterium]
MTINGVGNGAQLTLDDPSEGISTIGGELAMLVLNAQQAQRDTDHDELEVAREDFQRSLASEVDAMHSAANQVFWGAVAQGSLAIAGGAASVYGTVDSRSALSAALHSGDPAALQAACKPDVFETMGPALGQLSAPAGKLVSGSDGEDSLADAKAASGAGEQAKWRLDDLKNNLNRSNDVSDKATQWLSSAVDKDDASTRAVLSNLA